MIQTEFMLSGVRQRVDQSHSGPISPGIGERSMKDLLMRLA
jgi:hypothetical protein